MKKYKAFTLIELLVVIAIIALLMAVLAPALKKAKMQAKMAVCQSNLKQWGVISTLYTSEYNDKFMPGWTPEAGKHRWINLLRDIYEVDEVRLCPAATKKMYEIQNGSMVLVNMSGPFTAWGEFNDVVGAYEGAPGDYGSYGMNGWCYNPPSNLSEVNNGCLTKDCWRTPNVKGAYEIPLFLDSIWLDGYPHDNDLPPAEQGDWIGGYPHNMQRYCIDRHGNGVINSLFLDLSLQKVGLKGLWGLKWHRRYDTNATRPTWPDWMRSFSESD